MSRRYAILLRAGAPRGATAPEDWLLAREGTAWLALAFPALWLLFNGLWRWAIAALLVPLPLVVLSPLALWVVGLAIGALVALEGRELRIGKWERQGWRRTGTITAASRAEAEDRLAVLATRGGLAVRASRAVRPAPATIPAATPRTTIPQTMNPQTAAPA